jgi:hypothetical protein
MANEKMKFGTYIADVLSNDKTISFWREDGSHVAISVRPSRRITKAKIQKLMKRWTGVEQVYVRHSRYLCYNLRAVMTQRSGTYTVWTRHEVEGGKIVSSKTEVENELY